MCGIVGILHHGLQPDAERRTRAMAASIIHRGPDDDGHWSDGSISLGFRRLAIVDIASGHQPMANEDGSVHVVFNGEIYNHRELRHELEMQGHVFASDHSDTEVLVHGYEQWGEDLAGRLNGMFAFAIWDSSRRRLMLARDRLGIKPLYLAKAADGSLLFASEIRALHASGLLPVAPDDDAVFSYFMQQNTWQGQSLFKGVRQLESGSLLVDEGGTRRTRQYWRIDFDRREADPRKREEALRSAVQSAIARQVAADVPVMSYLSGGIDSSAITAAAYRLDPSIRAYSCIFDLRDVGDDRVADEREFARAVSAELGIEHVELQLPPNALETSLHRTIDALEEPRMGMAYVNYLIAERVAKDSKVVLSGCGGDEILGGYVARYAHIAKPYPQQDAGLWNRLRRRLGHPAQARMDALSRMVELYSYPIPPHETDQAFTGAFRSRVGARTLRGAIKDVLASCPSSDDRDRLMFLDAKTYLEGLLMVEDKLSMAHSLESRVPLLDNEIIDLAFTFDWKALTDGETGKIAFRNAIRKWVPDVIADKPKMGFGPPDASWYRGALQPFIRKMLAPERIRARGVFEPGYVARILDSHMSGADNRLPVIWSLLSFDAWCECFGVYGGDLGMPMRPKPIG